MSQPTISQQPGRDWVPIIITAVTALLGTGIIVSIYNQFISYVNAPNVQVVISSGGSNNNTFILMKNTGQTAATHVRLMVNTPEEITRFYNFSTENMTLQKVNSTLLEGNMKRLVHGAGSFVNISLIIKAKPNINYTRNYAAFATYDQGSNIGGFSLKYPQYWSYIIYFIVYIPIPIVVYFYIRYLIRRRYKKRIDEIEIWLNDITSPISEIYPYEAGVVSADIYERDLGIHKRDLALLLHSRELLKELYFRGRLQRKEYDHFIDKLGGGIEKLQKYINAPRSTTSTMAPPKSVHKVTRYTSEGKPIITDY